MAVRKLGPAAEGCDAEPRSKALVTRGYAWIVWKKNVEASDTLDVGAAFRKKLEPSVALESNSHG